jgi:trigger factor
LDYSIENVENLIYEVKLTIPVEEVQPKIDESLQTLRKEITIPGFRKGKVPMDLVKARYARSIEDEVFNDLINDKFKEIMQSEDYQVIGGGVVKSMDWKPKEALLASVEFQVAPTVDLKNIDNLNVVKEVQDLKDDDVENTIQKLREQHAVVKPVEDGAKEGHFVLADFQEIDAGGSPLIGKKLVDRHFKLGSGIFGEKFDQQLVGVKNGDERSVEVSFEPKPGEQTKEFYQVIVKKVEEQILPELDEEFAKSIGEYETFDALKESIKKQLESELVRQSDDKLHQSLIDEVVKNNPFDLPPLMVDSYLHTWFEDIKKESKQELNEQEVKERNRPFAIRNIKWHMIKEELVKQEKLKVEDKDIEDSLNEIAEKAKVDLKEIKKYYRQKRQKDELTHQIEEKRIFERLLKTAKVEEVKVSDQPSNVIQTA